MISEKRVQEMKRAVLMEALLGSVDDTDGVRLEYFWKELEYDDWVNLVHRPLVEDGMFNFDGGPAWVVSAKGLKFLKGGE